MKLPIHIAKKLFELLQPGKTIASSTMQHIVITKMLDDGIIQKQQIGKTKSLFFISDTVNLAAYLHNHFGIQNLAAYINTLESEEQSRADNIMVSGNSKLLSVRTFKGFLINCYDTINATIDGKPVTIHPLHGTYTYLNNYANFIVDKAVTIVGIENPENFRQIEKQRYLFSDIKALFVSRYPQSNDLIKWLSAIPNNYLHFGDLDFAGINIYQNEFKKHLGSKANFFLPSKAEMLLQKIGNRELFNKQYNPSTNYAADVAPEAMPLLKMILKYKKVLEQEVFINL